MGHMSVGRSHPDYLQLLVLNMVLGGQFVSRINMNLREDKGYTYGVRTAFEARRGPGPFLLQASVQSEATGEAIKESIAEIEAIRGERPVTRDEHTVTQAAARHLDVSRLLTVIVGDRDRIDSALAPLALGEPLDLAVTA